MTWWLRARRVRAVVAAIGLLAATILLAPALAVPMPALFAAYGLNVPLVLIAPLGVSTALGWGLMAAATPLDLASSRRMDALDRGYVLAVVGAGAGAALLAATAAGVPIGTGVARSLLACAGMLLLGRWLLGGNAGPSLPVGVFLAMALFGGDANGDPRWWAFVLASGDSPVAWLLAITSFAAGFIAMGRTPLFRPSD